MSKQVTFPAMLDEERAKYVNREITYEQTIKALRQQLAGNIKRKVMLRDALWKIANPIDAMQAKLREGEKLNWAMAVMLASDPSYLKGIAQKALAATDDLSKYILCEKEPFAYHHHGSDNADREFYCVDFEPTHAMSVHNGDMPLYRAWEPK